MKRPPYTQPELRFWLKVKKTDDCWLWTGAKTGRGYGNFLLYKEDGKGKYIGAHKYSYILHYGDVEGQVNHTCDNPLCVNPDHLWDGSQSANCLDMYDKGRGRWQRIETL